MKEIISELEALDRIVCGAMKQWDGVDMARIPKEFHGYREILAKLDGIITKAKSYVGKAEQEQGDVLNQGSIHMVSGYRAGKTMKQFMEFSETIEKGKDALFVGIEYVAMSIKKYQELAGISGANKAPTHPAPQEDGLRKRCPNWDIKWDDGGCLKEDGFREPHPEFCPDNVTNNCWIRRKKKPSHPAPQEDGLRDYIQKKIDAERLTSYHYASKIVINTLEDILAHPTPPRGAGGGKGETNLSTQNT